MKAMSSTVAKYQRANSPIRANGFDTSSGGLQAAKGRLKADLELFDDLAAAGPRDTRLRSPLSPAEKCGPLYCTNSDALKCVK
eukprot:scaffold167408_cov17-Prasinocladus_malaysianus.AAC.1